MLDIESTSQHAHLASGSNGNEAFTGISLEASATWLQQQYVPIYCRSWEDRIVLMHHTLVASVLWSICKFTLHVVIDRISTGVYIIASIYPFICPTLSILSFELSDLWFGPFACIWVMTIDLVGFKVKVKTLGQKVEML